MGVVLSATKWYVLRKDLVKKKKITNQSSAVGIIILNVKSSLYTELCSKICQKIDKFIIWC